MEVFFVVASCLFFLWVLRELFFWVFIWQENEYRQDRFFYYLKNRIKKTKFFTLAFVITKSIIFFSYIIVIFNDNFQNYYQYIIILFFIFEAYLVLRDIYHNQIKKPRLNLRANSIIILTIITVFLLFTIPLTDRFFWLLLIDLSIFPMIMFYVFLFMFPIEIYTDWKIEKAGQKIRSYKNLLVIAVTGSVGKSLVKDYLAEILGKRFAVVKTKGKNNTITGIASTIIKDLSKNTEIFIAEISAYKVGEINLLCRFIRPTIGILTAINSHYLPLFKTIENIKKTNNELVNYLPKNGFCLYTGNNKNTLSLYKNSKKTKVIYKTADNHEVGGKGINEISAYNIQKKKQRISFDIQLNQEQFHFQLGIHHHLEQVLPAIYIAHHLGMTEKEIKQALMQLK